jgi:hypothetical protein
MGARLARHDSEVLAALTDELRGRLDANATRPLHTGNPCWYRWTLQSITTHTPTQVSAVVRVYQHQWASDAAGGPPHSWYQEVGLARTNGTWRIERLGSVTNERPETADPHGPMQSACARS